MPSRGILKGRGATFKMPGIPMDGIPNPIKSINSSVSSGEHSQSKPERLAVATKRRKEESGDQKLGGDGEHDDDDESQDVPEHALCHLEES